jgi:hypothetical protein
MRFATHTGIDSVGKKLIFFSLIGLSVLLFGCQSSNRGKTPLPLAQAPNTLTVGYVVKITFPATPELNQSQKI